MTWTTATASVVIGLLLSTRALRAKTGPWFLDLHRFLGGITVVFLLAHIGTLWADSYVDFGPRELFVPGASEWRSEAIAWGIIAAYLLIAVEVTSLLRSRINGKLWRVVHFSSFAAMVGGSYHAWLAGSDVQNPITWAIAGIGSLLVVGLVSMRLQRQEDPDDVGDSRSLRDQRAVLEEMRKRLEDLPIPESTPQPQISATPNASLPRRSPVSDALPGMDSSPRPRPDAESAGFDDDPFAAVPLPSREPALGDWAAPSPADPFNVANTQPVEPAAFVDTPAEAPAEATTEALPQRAPWSDDGAELFEDLAADPFEALGLTPAQEREGFPELPVLEEKPDLFAAAVEGDPSADFLSSPFETPMPTESVIQAPAEPRPRLDGPPPLPDAVDPLTGEPDEAAYSVWLKDWLSYAEQYGDEAPEDPSRV